MDIDFKKMMIATMVATSQNKQVAKRIHAKDNEGRVGITSWHTDETIIDELLLEIKQAGHEFIKIETKTII